MALAEGAEWGSGTDAARSELKVGDHKFTCGDEGSGNCIDVD